MIFQETRVAIIDDAEIQAETMAGVAEEATFETYIIRKPNKAFGSPKELFGIVKDEGCGAVICDHRLSPQSFAAFSGAEFVAYLFDWGMPAVLLSTFSSIDSDSSIRLFRDRIPSLIGRNELEPDTIMDGLSRSESELAGNYTPDRKPWRTLVRVEGVTKLGEDFFAEAVVHTWEPEVAIRYPLEVIKDESIRLHLMKNNSWPVRLFAEVNVGCTNERDLFLKSFEWAPEPNDNDLAS